MSSLFAKTFKQALKTFDRTNNSGFKKNFELLKELVDELTLKDILINENLMTEIAFTSNEHKAPCTFLHIFENKDVAMSVFILKSAYQMPLHDHPGMCGILKVISGTVLVQSYTKIDCDNEISSISSASDQSKVYKVEKEPIKLLDSSQSTILTPNQCNYHKIESVNGVAAFFDILSPPYNTISRKCNFYREIFFANEEGSSNENKLFLQQIKAPNTYYCDSEEYKKPDWLLEYNDTYCESE